jgi:transcriptional regulator with XRE-family HTH domain
VSLDAGSDLLQNASLIDQENYLDLLMSHIMPKPLARPASQYSQDALQLLGQLIRAGRLGKAMTTTNLATRAGISRALLQRIERGDPGCSIGAVFETAALCGVTLFETDAASLAAQLDRQQDKLALLPQAVRTARRAVKDDF